MGRRNKSPGDRPRVKQSQLAMEDQIANSLTTLQHLAEIYDDKGFSSIAISMATEIQKILTEDKYAIQMRGSRSFPTPAVDINEEALNNQMKLVSLEMSGGPTPSASFVPAFVAQQPMRRLPFRDWWNRDVIYLAGAAMPGTPFGLIPVNRTPSMPPSDRERSTRRTFVTYVRNTFSAHLDDEVPAILDDMAKTAAFGGEPAMQFGDGPILTTEDGTLPLRVGTVPAMLRQIGYEVLVAYDRV